MRVYWLNCCLTFKPRTRKEHRALKLLGKFYSELGYPDKNDYDEPPYGMGGRKIVRQSRGSVGGNANLIGVQERREALG